MTVQYSVQKMVSDGTLSTVALGIQYLQRNDIYMRIAGEETPQSGAASGYTWSFIDNTTLKITPVVPTGVDVVIYRRTDIDAMYNIYSQNAQFDEATIDENNQQLLYIAQEYLEQGIPGAGVEALEYINTVGGINYYRFRLTDGNYTTLFGVPDGTDVLRTELDSEVGPSIIRFKQSGTGTVLRTLQSKSEEDRTSFDTGAVGDTTTNDTVSIQNMLLSTKPVTLKSAIGYKVTSGLTNNCAAMVHGEGLSSALHFSGLPTYVDAFKFSPPADGNAREYAGLSDVYILQSSGGGHAVLVDVSAAGQIVSRFKVDSSYLRANGAGNYAFVVHNPTNAADRFFLGYFENSVFDGGLLLNGVGDSINVIGNTFTGVNEALYLNQTTASSPGAFGPSSMAVFERNNSTANKGVYIVNAQSPKVKNNNLECGAGPGAGAEQALVNILGQTHRIFGAEVTGNALLHGPNCTTGVFVGNTDGALIENNIFGLAATGYAIVVSADSKNARIGFNTYQPAGTGREVQDLGVGTMGVQKTPTLLNSWVNASGLQPVSFIKTLDRVVLLSGVISSGVVTSGTILFILPNGFRPKDMQFFSTYGYTSGGVYVSCVVRVDTDGSVRFVNSSGGASTLVGLGLCGISFVGVDIG